MYERGSRKGRRDGRNHWAVLFLLGSRGPSGPVRPAAGEGRSGGLLADTGSLKPEAPLSLL
jgi:hypothetical protein